MANMGEETHSFRRSKQTKIRMNIITENYITHEYKD
jgi:hypothetical protein